MRIKRGYAAAILAVALVIACGLATTGVANAASSKSSVYVVHGIPGQNVDVYVNGKKTLSDFKPKSVAGPLSLAAGTYDVALTKPGDPVSSAILENKALAVPADRNISLVAHLNTSGKPTLTAFVNDTSTISAGKARLVVRHVADAPAVDVRAGGTPVFTDLTNPHQAMSDITAGTVSADVVLHGTKTVVLGPTSLHLAAGSETIVYAIGSASGKTLALAAQTMTGLGGAPSGMPAGSGGRAATGVDAWWYAIVAFGLVLIGSGAFGGRRLLVARRVGESPRG